MQRLLIAAVSAGAEMLEQLGDDAAVAEVPVRSQVVNAEHRGPGAS